MKYIISESRLHQMVFNFLDLKFKGLERVKGKNVDIVFKYPGDEFGIMGWKKPDELWISRKLLDNIYSYFPMGEFTTKMIITMYVEDRYNLKVKNDLTDNPKNGSVLNV